MSDQANAKSVDQKAEDVARELGRMVLEREMTIDESTAMATIFKAAVQALRHGFVKRLAEQVRAERESETVEEFFQNIKPD